MIENRHWTQALFSLAVEGAALAFEAGQFVRIALDIGGERVARPFSFVNPPDDPVLEFYGIVVPEGPLSPRLAQLQAGRRALSWRTTPPASWCSPKCPTPRPLAGVHRHRHRAVPLDPAHRGALAALRQRGAGPCGAPRERAGLPRTDRRIPHGRRFRYVNFVSREKAPGALAGRIPAAMRDGRLEAAGGPSFRRSLAGHAVRQSGHAEGRAARR